VPECRLQGCLDLSDRAALREIFQHFFILKFMVGRSHEKKQ